MSPFKANPPPDPAGTRQPEPEPQRLHRAFSDAIETIDIAMWELDLHYRVVAANRKARQVYGDQAVNDFCYHVADQRETVCPNCPAGLIYDGRESGRSVYKRVDAHGNPFYVDHIASPIRDGAGNLTGVLVMVIDITPHKQMAEELQAHQDRLEELVTSRTAALRESEKRYRRLYMASQRSEELYRSVLSSSADAIVVYDLSGIPLYINPSFTRIFGWEFSELNGRRIPFVPDSELATTREIIVDLLENGTPCQGYITRRFTRDGRILDISLSASRYHDHEGKAAGMLVILRDITDEKRMEHQLRHAERMEAIGTLAGGVAHDFNNLMMGILGNISLMVHDLPPEHPHVRRLKQMEELIQSGSRLTGQLLGYARQGSYELKPLDLNQVVGRALRTFGRTRKEIIVEWKPAADLKAVEADAAQVEQVMMNLCINAADAMTAGGVLTVSTANLAGDRGPSRPEGLQGREHALIQVADTGCGIDEKNIKRIFDPFFTTKELGRGTGLGLASVYGIIQMHGGHIDVQSRVGKGTTFNIYLPVSAKPIHAIPAAPEAIREGEGTLLLVDDEAMVLDVGEQMLSKLGYTVLTAASFDEAVRAYTRHRERIDLVILDMILPGRGGSETFDALKAINPGVKVLLSSGYSIEGKAREILSRGCAGFIQKPFRLETISRKIRGIIGRPGEAPPPPPRSEGVT